MHRTGLIEHNIKKELRKSDFYFSPSLKDDGVLANSISEAANILATPAKLAAKITYAQLGGKAVARASDHSSTIALRMLNRGLSEEISGLGNRESIVVALRTILSEQVPFSVIKLDVGSFYESFSDAATQQHLNDNRELSSSTRVAIKTILHNHSSLGFTGLPRGLVISPTLADAMMRTFDNKLSSDERIFFYRRFVDDIVVITTTGINCPSLIQELELILPSGLKFKASKNVTLSVEKSYPKEKASGKQTKYLTFNYLGYSFNVANAEHNYRKDATRDVWLDIAPNKVSRTKTRIMKSYVDFIRTNDFPLLEKRLRHLTSNISIRDRSKGITRLSGIHFNYPLVDLNRTKSLRELDAFLRTTLNSTKGRIFGQLSVKLTPSQRAQLLRNSFYSGAKLKRFYQFNPKELGRIQRCWKHE